jgi:polyisoprenoid-binding protein YceI
MTLHKAALALMTVAVFGCLQSCTLPPPAAAAHVQAASATGQSSFAEIQVAYDNAAKAGGRVLTLDPSASAVRIYAFRAGTAARVGHNHVLSAPRFSGLLYLPPNGAEGTRFDLEFRLDQLEIDNPDYRSKLGPAFASALNEAAIDGTREHMLGEDNMQADRFPFVRIRSLAIVGEAPRFAARVQVELHGQSREMWVPLVVEDLAGEVSGSGSLVLRQTDFGIQPYSVLGGLLAVQDEVVIEFRLVGKPASTPPT